MKYVIEISEAAEKDIHSAFLWYENQKTGLGIGFEIEISSAVNSIQNNPLKTQIRYSNIRVFFLKKFPYGIHFRVTDKTILIIAVFATKDDPVKWKGRN